MDPNSIIYIIKHFEESHDKFVTEKYVLEYKNK